MFRLTWLSTGVKTCGAETAMPIWSPFLLGPIYMLVHTSVMSFCLGMLPCMYQMMATIGQNIFANV